MISFTSLSLTACHGSGVRDAVMRMPMSGHWMRPLTTRRQVQRCMRERERKNGAVILNAGAAGVLLLPLRSSLSFRVFCFELQIAGKSQRKGKSFCSDRSLRPPRECIIEPKSDLIEIKGLVIRYRTQSACEASFLPFTYSCCCGHSASSAPTASPSSPLSLIHSLLPDDEHECL